MLLALLYHRVSSGKYANSLEMMEEHLSYIAKTFPIALPGDPLSLGKIQVCLTFDDAYYDFYHYVFPLLKKLKLRALLAVPVKYILPTTSIAPEKRLRVPYSLAMEGNTYQELAPFCTREELQEMAGSGSVQIASHSFSHQNLLAPGIDRIKEIIISKKILESWLGVTISTFVYPLGKFDSSLHAEVKLHYPFAMRIGSACNFSWNNHNGLTYRILCDGLQKKTDRLNCRSFPSHLWFYLLNSIRGR